MLETEPATLLGPPPFGVLFALKTNEVNNQIVYITPYVIVLIVITLAVLFSAGIPWQHFAVIGAAATPRAVMVGDRPSTDGLFARTLGCRTSLK